MVSDHEIILAIVAVLLTAVLFWGGQLGGYYPRARQYWTICGAGAIGAALLPSWWLAAGILWFYCHALYDQDKGVPDQGGTQYLYLAAQAQQVAIYTLLVALCTVSVQLPVLDTLWVIASTAVPLAFWTAVSQYYWPNEYKLEWWKFCLFEHKDSQCLAVGQGGFNHTEGVAGVVGAVALGLTTVTPWAWVFVLAALSPILVNRWNRRIYTEGWRQWRGPRTAVWARQGSQGDVFMLALALV